MDLSRALSEEVLRRGNHGIEVRVASHGSPVDYQRRRLLGLDAVLRACGCYEGRPLDQTILAALDLQTAVMGLLSARDVSETLAEGVTALGYLGRVLAEEKSAGVMTELAHAIDPEGGDGELGRLARKLRPLTTPGSTSAA
jgi:hypothetical protein